MQKALPDPLVLNEHDKAARKAICHIDEKDCGKRMVVEARANDEENLRHGYSMSLRGFKVHPNYMTPWS